MNAKNLPLKLTCVALAATLCVWLLIVREPKEGIDVRGGHSLIFKIRSPQEDIPELRNRLKNLEGELAAAKASSNKEKIEDLKHRIEETKKDIERREDSRGDTKLSERMIEILKERIDPHGLADLYWRPVGSDRIEVRMPAGREKTRQRREAYEAALNDLRGANITSGEKRLYRNSSSEQRAEVGKGYTGRQVERLRDYGEAYDAHVRTQKSLDAARQGGDGAAIKKAQEARDIAWATFREKEERLAETDVSVPRLMSALQNFRTPEEEEDLKEEESKELREQLARDLARLGKEHTDRKAQVDRVAEAYKAWARVRHRLSDPADLQRRIARAGVLEFRIVTGYRGMHLDQKDQEFYTDLLEKEGPEEVRRRGAPYAWFPLRDNDNETFSGTILAEYAGRWYMLLCNTDGFRMVRQRIKGGWQLTDVFQDNDRMGRLAIGFKFDEAGARLFHNLTSAHVEKDMAILLDDEVFSAPRIQSAISDRGQITGKFSRDEIDDYIRLLEAGSLPARVDPNPVSMVTFGPSIGKENRDKGIQAAYLGLACVAAFMLVYYLLAGALADVALLLNILFVLGGMYMFDATFTLPGIAGVVLTIGIAVDANVLIFERLREEQATGKSVRQALKNAYERAFTAIFDANITTLITCFILGWVGTIEVRGFAITLGIGVVFSMFTALVVTRWIFQALLDRKWLTRRIRMLSIIGVPKINWMGKRKGFWALSMVLIVLGVASLIWQGGSIWGIEFSAGTQAMLKFRDDALIGGGAELPSDGLVRRLFAGQAEEDQKKGEEDQSKTDDPASKEKLGKLIRSLETLRQPRVEMIVDRDRAGTFLGKYDTPPTDQKVTLAEAKAARLNEAFFRKIDANNDQVLDRAELEARLPASGYQVSTTETQLNLIQDVARRAFGGNLARRTKCSFAFAAGQEAPELGLTLDNEGKARIEVVAASPHRNLLEDYEGGVAVVVRDVRPAITEADLTERLREIRRQDRAGEAQMRPTQVLGLGRPNEDEEYSSFAVLTKLEEVVSARWLSAAGAEVTNVGEALEREEFIEAISYDRAIAGRAIQQAVIALILSWLAIVLYLWLRFGSIQWGFAAVICLIHDVIIVVGLVAASGWLYDTFLGKALGIGSFKIDLPMVAAILTTIGYSVNDTIVVFDRIRENRGKLATVTVPVINRSVNQMLARTLLTSGTTFVVVIIMYIWGGQGIKPFNYALLAGIIFGTYSSVAIASPLLMGFRQAIIARAVEAPAPA